MLLHALQLSCGSFSHPRALFSIACGLFCENSGGGIPLPHLHESRVTSPSCAKAQKSLFVSPLLATLTDSLSRKSFPCHSYANTRGVCTTPPKFFAFGLQLSTGDCKMPFPLTTFRINTCISVASKRLYPPLESTLTKKGGRGVPPIPLSPAAPAFRSGLRRRIPEVDTDRKAWRDELASTGLLCARGGSLCLLGGRECGGGRGSAGGGGRARGGSGAWCWPGRGGLRCFG
jgi:hypothetical protein